MHISIPQRVYTLLIIEPTLSYPAATCSHREVNIHMI